MERQVRDRPVDAATIRCNAQDLPQLIQSRSGAHGDQLLLDHELRKGVPRQRERARDSRQGGSPNDLNDPTDVVVVEVCDQNQTNAIRRVEAKAFEICEGRRSTIRVEARVNDGPVALAEMNAE